MSLATDPGTASSLTALIDENSLSARGDQQQALFAQAREVRDHNIGRKVFVRAVVEVSNFCRQNCSYCGMRRDNADLERFRITREELREIIFHSLPPSVTDINFQAGEDPVAVREIVLPLIREIATTTRLGISVCLGTLSPQMNRELQQAGAAYYIIKIETGDKNHYQLLQAPGSLEKRLATIRELSQSGWFVSSGLISGLPQQTTDHVLQSLRLLTTLPLAGVSVSPFIPGSATPSAHAEAGDIHEALNCLALLRLANPERIIPAVSAFNILHSSGYVNALRAGANLVTINLTPPVQREKYLLYRSNRFIMNEQRVLQAIAEAGGEPSRTSLVQWLQNQVRPAPA